MSKFWAKGGYFVRYISAWVSQSGSTELPFFEEYDGIVRLGYKNYMQSEHPLVIDLWKYGFYNDMFNIVYGGIPHDDYKFSEW